MIRTQLLKVSALTAVLALITPALPALGVTTTPARPPALSAQQATYNVTAFANALANTAQTRRPRP